MKWLDTLKRSHTSTCCFFGRASRGSARESVMLWVPFIKRQGYCGSGSAGAAAINKQTKRRPWWVQPGYPEEERTANPPPPKKRKKPYSNMQPVRLGESLKDSNQDYFFFSNGTHQKHEIMLPKIIAIYSLWIQYFHLNITSLSAIQIGPGGGGFGGGDSDRVTGTSLLPSVAVYQSRTRRDEWLSCFFSHHLHPICYCSFSGAEKFGFWEHSWPCKAHYIKYCTFFGNKIILKQSD